MVQNFAPKITISFDFGLPIFKRCLENSSYMLFDSILAHFRSKFWFSGKILAEILNLVSRKVDVKISNFVSPFLYLYSLKIDFKVIIK